MNESVSRLVTTTRGMMSIITRRSFSSCTPQTRNFQLQSQDWPFDCSSFSRQSVSSLSVLKRMLALGDIFLRLSTSSHVLHMGLPWDACVDNYKRLFLNKTHLSSMENILQSSARCKSFFRTFCFVTETSAREFTTQL